MFIVNYRLSLQTDRQTDATEINHAASRVVKNIKKMFWRERLSPSVEPAHGLPILQLPLGHRLLERSLTF